MPEAPHTANDEAALAVPGLLHVNPVTPTKSTVSWGRATGWLLPRGIQDWERELSFVAREDLTPELARKIRATLPSEQIAPRKYPWTAKAAEASPVLPVAGNLTSDLRKHGVRIHTVGVDRVSAGFFYFAEGGAAEPVQVQGNLVDMIAPALSPTATNDDIAALMTDLVDRLLSHFSGGLLTELHAELADALPRLSRDGKGLVGTDLDAFEARTAALAQRSARWDAEAPRLVETLRAAEASRGDTATVPLYGVAAREVVAALDVQVGSKQVRLPERSRWTVTGVPVAAPKAEPAVRAEAPAARRLEPAPVAAAPAPAPATARAPAVAAASPTPAPVAAAATPQRVPVPSPAPARAAMPEHAVAPSTGVSAGPPTSSEPAPVAPIQPMAIAIISGPSPAETPGAVATNDGSAVEAVVPSTSAIEVNLHSASAPSSEVPAPAPAPQPLEPAAGAPAEVRPEAEPAETAQAPRRAPKQAAAQLSAPSEDAMPEAALAPTGKRSTGTSLGFFLALVLFAIAGLLWRWLHHHSSPFHLPFH